MDIITSAIIIAIIYLIVFVAIDYYFVAFHNKHISEYDMGFQCQLQFGTVFIVTALLGILEIDVLLCAANH